MQSLDDCRCPMCDGSLQAQEPLAGDAIVDKAIICTGCGRTFPAVWGVPFICEYEQAEILGLIEIAANAEADPRIPRQDIVELESELAVYHAADDKPAFLAESKSRFALYIRTRYAEWLQIKVLTEHLDLRGKLALDVGAGVGFDTNRLVAMGATVTALEFSPLLCRAGARELPEVRWIGGLSHVLPFRDRSFDYVFCNAALHHMRDIRQSIGEMLRVVRPGGAILTSSDSYRADGIDDGLELRIFNDNPAVLMGVNERIPRLSEFIDTLREHKSALAVAVYTSDAYDVPQEDGSLASFHGLRSWKFDLEMDRLARSSGSIAMRIDIISSPSVPPAHLAEGGLPAGRLAGALASQSDALADLSPRVPAEHVNTAFPGVHGTKFELLNGWKTREAGLDERTAYRRARWYLRRRARQATLAFQVSAACPQVEGRTLLVLIDNKPCAERPDLAAGWQDVFVDATRAESDVTFCVELRLLGPEVENETRMFKVRRRRFVGGSVVAAFADRMLSRFDIASLIRRARSHHGGRTRGR